MGGVRWCLAALAAGAAGAPLCPAICKASDNSEWPCRYYDQDCTVSPTASSHRGTDLVDINIAAINPYSGGLGDLMTMIEPSIAQATQDIENSNLLPGYRLKVHLVNSKCSVADATYATQATCSTGPKKHVLLSDSCSEACAAVNDAARFFQLLQVGPGCVSARLRNSERYPYFTRMAPSTYYNTVAIFELMKFLSFKRIGVIYGYRDIMRAAKELFLGLVNQDLQDASYPWTVLTTLRLEYADDVRKAVEETHHHDARINFMALYEPEGAAYLCQAYRDGMRPPDYSYFVASGWWNEQYIRLTANSENCPCGEQELLRASYGLIAADRGPMLRTEEVHSLSGRRLRDLYDEYTTLCEAFGNGIGSCNHQWAGYFYDGLWLIAKVLDDYLVQQNHSIDDLGTSASREALYTSALAVDFYGQTGRVHQWRSDWQVDRAGIVLLRQVAGTPEKAFRELAHRTAEGFDFQMDILWSPDGEKKVTCHGSSCDFDDGWVPLDGVDQCDPGHVWSKALGCSPCDPGTFSVDGHGACKPCPEGSFGNESGMALCPPCAPGTANPLTGMTACIPCLAGHFMNESGELLCQQCPMGAYAAANGHASCTPCPPGRTTTFEGATDEELCRCDGILFEGVCMQCESGTRFELGACVSCEALEICEKGVVVGYRSSEEEWHHTIDMAGEQIALSQELARRYLLVSMDLDVHQNLQKLRSSVIRFEENLRSLLHGNASQEVLPPPTEEVQEALDAVQRSWSAFQATLAVQLDGRWNQVQDRSAAFAQLDQQSSEVLSATQHVRHVLAEASEKAGWHSGMLEEIAARQQMLILYFAKEVSLISLGHKVSESRFALAEAADLFEASQEAIIFGVDSVGLPHLHQMCAMRQMRDVTFYSMQVIEMVQEVVNAESNSESQATANRILGELSNLTEPFFLHMVEATELLEGHIACEEHETTQGEWKALLSASAAVRCRCEMSFLYFMQILNGVEVDASKVKLTVQISSEHLELRKLVQGSRMDGIPTPPTQEIMDEMLEALAAWSRLAPLLAAAAELDTVPEGHLARTVRLREALELRMDWVLHRIEDAANASDWELQGMPLTTLDLLHHQKMQMSRMMAEAHLVLHDYKAEQHWEMLNATVRHASANSQRLILGVPGSSALQPIRNLCTIHDMADAMTMYRQIANVAYDVANGNRDKAYQVMELIPEGGQRMNAVMQRVDDFYKGALESETCSRTLTTEEWLQLMAEVVRLACLGEELELNSSALSLSLDRLQVGSIHPAVPAPPTEDMYQQVLEVLTPLVEDLIAQVPGASAAKLSGAAWTLLERYTAEGLATDAAWPGERLKVFLWQKVLVMQVYQDQMTDGRVEEHIKDFEAGHEQLKNGGGSFGPAAAQESLVEALQSIDEAWLRFKELPQPFAVARYKARRNDLLAALDDATPLFAVPDPVDNSVKVPWGYYVVYPILGVVALCCCAGACCLGRQAAQKRSTNAAKEGP